MSTGETRWTSVTSMARARTMIREFRYHDVEVSPDWSNDAGGLTVRVQKQDVDFLCSRFFADKGDGDDLRVRKDRTADRLLWVPMRGAA